MSKYSVIKSELKALISQIRSAKAAFKESQREGSGGGDWRLKGNKENLSWQYRHMHLAYGLLRGRTMEQMEAKVAQGNEPNMELVKSYMAELSSKVVITEVVHEDVSVGS